MMSLQTIKKLLIIITKHAIAVFHRPLIVSAICINMYLFSDSGKKCKEE